ncbi:putative V-set and transmembrane domain-containing protein 4-like [Scophthalmus maximus]|uniref:Putative V-set and transmembrane domain-containing protein 4-like n=1 Tax=Scophthalmus maximus TaxID=52904 RepID=A0A2U9CCX7_SCOMX|nr:putative V-set and transmembrane domain-containing protein 4-like [Scophthalmus maximus]
MYFSVVVLVLTKALVSEVCHTLNVTVNPGPVVTVTEKDNLTLSCLVSQRKRSSSVLILRWFFSPVAAPLLPSAPSPPAPSPPGLEPSHFLIVKMGIKKMKLYGNYTRRFPQPKFRLYEETESELYRLRIFSVTGADQGFYACKVQEIRKHRNIWRASSNGTSTTQLTVHFTSEDGSSEGLWRLFADVYLCAVLICSLGLLSIFLFTLVLACQHLHRRHRLKASYLLVKCPESSSGETVTSSSSSSSSSPRAQRKDTRRNTDRGVAATPPKLPVEPPPHIPAKVPVAAKRPQKPRRLKTQPRRSAAEDSLTYAELELVRPRPEPQASSSPDPTPASSDTVYAQILFQERKL